MTQPPNPEQQPSHQGDPGQEPAQPPQAPAQPPQQPVQPPQAPGQASSPSQPDPYEQQPAYGQQPSPYGQQPTQPYGGQQPASGQQPSPYGQQPTQPYGGQQPASGQQQGQQYGQNQYGQPMPPDQTQYSQPPYGQQPAPYGQDPYAQPGQPAPYAPIAFATWGDRALASLWDILYLWPALAVMFGSIFLFIIGSVASTQSQGLAAVFFILAVMGYLVGAGLSLWIQVVNYVIDQGRTGYTYGKRKVGIRLIKEQTGGPVGAGSCVGRWFLHILINQAFYIDYLWPLWDEKKQTLTDKIVDTVEIKVPDTSGHQPGRFAL